MQYTKSQFEMRVGKKKIQAPLPDGESQRAISAIVKWPDTDKSILENIV